LPSRVIGAALLYVVGACVLGSLRSKWSGVEMVLLAGTVCADTVWCAAAFLYFGPLNSLPAVVYATAMSAFAAWISPSAGAVAGISCAMAYYGTVRLLHPGTPVLSLPGQLAAYQTITMALAGVFSASVAHRLLRYRRTQRMASRLVHLNDATADMVTERGYDGISSAAAEQATAILDASGAWVTRFEPGAAELVLTSHNGVLVPQGMPTRVPHDVGMGGQVLRAGEGSALPASADNAEHLSIIEAALSRGHIVAAPVPGPHIFRGVLYATRPATDEAFDVDDMHALTLFARSVGRTLHTAGVMGLLRQSTETDALTGLNNQGAFLRMLSEHLRDAQASQSEFAVIVLDLDDFKGVNDQTGHWRGNRVLRALGDALQGCLRGDEIIARFGGDEFAVLVPDVSPDAAAAIACRIGSAIREAVETMALPVPLAASVGVATYPRDAETADGLFKAADARLYEAKHAGGDCVVSGDRDEKPLVIGQV
ncbi:MAG TPA: GGDEF domain-containing protein, partial [Armatimonadota bacterium]|nr:GGDEF domain-containing protein [Armatimonadota bacterium]